MKPPTLAAVAVVLFAATAAAPAAAYKVDMQDAVVSNYNIDTFSRPPKRGLRANSQSGTPKGNRAVRRRK